MPLSKNKRVLILSNLILSRWLWERGEKGGASLQKQARAALCCNVRYKPHACLCIELPHLTRRLPAALATRTNIETDSFSLCVPRLDKPLTGCEKGLCVYDRAASPLGRRQVNDHCLQGVFFTGRGCRGILSHRAK